MTVKVSAVRERAIQSLKESHARGDSIKVTLRHLSKCIDMGVPAARSVRDFLLRTGQIEAQL